jgi:hypothetical protein
MTTIDDERVAAGALPRPPVDLVLTNAPKPLDVGQVALLHSAYGHPHLGSSNGLQRPEPLRERAGAIVQQ